MLWILVTGLVAVSFVGVAAVLRHWKWDLRRASMLAVVFLATDFVLRPTELLIGLDEPFPNEHFEGRTVVDALARAQASFLLWLALFVLTVALVERFLETSALAESVGSKIEANGSRLLPDDRAVQRVLPLLVGFGFIGSAYAWNRFGLTGLASAAKGKELDLPHMLRVPAIGAAYFGMAVATAGVARKHRSMSVIGGLAFIAGAFVSFTWGARGNAVFPFVIPAIAALSGMETRPLRSSAEWRRVALRVFLAFIVVCSMGVGLRVVREVVSLGGTNARTTQGPIFRRLAITANHTRYDAALLVFDDDEPTPESPGLDLFINGSSRALSPIVPPRGSFEPPAITVAQTFEPWRNNGWPLTALGDWFFAGRWGGVALGAIVSGLIFGLIDAWQALYRRRYWAVTTGFVAIWSTTLTWGGFGATTPARARSMLPILIVLMLLATLLGRGTRPAALKETATSAS